MANLRYAASTLEFSRKLRSEMTETEIMLWSRLRRKQIHRVQFYRQKSIGRYIVDFYAKSVQ